MVLTLEVEAAAGGGVHREVPSHVTHRAAEIEAHLRARYLPRREPVEPLDRRPRRPVVVIGGDRISTRRQSPASRGRPDPRRPAAVR